MTNKQILLTLILWNSIFVSNNAGAAIHASQFASDIYLQGYVQSIFVHSYGLPSDAVIVKNNIIIIDEDRVADKSPEFMIDKIRQAVSKINTAKKISVITKKFNKINNINLTHKEELVNTTMPNGTLFQPLVADPKWPRFTVAYQYYTKDKTLKHAFAPNFGASFPIHRIVNNKTGSEWEIGVQAGLFGLMDIGSNPTALINADYFVGIPITYRNGQWSSLARFYHISSHLGDEYMLTKEGKKTRRINLSYEGIDLLASLNFDGTRVYGGGGYIVHKDPSYVKPLKFQLGAEYYAHNTYFYGRIRPVSGIDFKIDEQGKWYPSISCKTGIQFENSALLSHKVQLMLEYYKGKSIHGQFYNDKVEYIGIGIQGFL